MTAAFVSGCFFYRWQARQAVVDHFARMSIPEVRRATAEFSKAADLLNALRAGNTHEAIETLESELDTQIMYIGAVTELTAVSERDEQWLSRIRCLRDYRAKHPRKSDPTIDEQVAHYLSLVETNR